MARRGKWELTWCKGENRWRKRFDGKTYHFPLQKGETKDSSRSRVLGEWHKLRGELAAAEQTTSALQARLEAQHAEIQRMAQWQRETDAKLAAFELLRPIVQAAGYQVSPKGRVARGGADYTGQPVEIPPHVLAALARVLPVLERPEPQPKSQHPAPPPTVERFLAEYQGKVERGERSQARLDNIRMSLKAFQDVLGETPIEQAQRSHLVAYVATLSKRVTKLKKPMHPATVNVWLAGVRRFFRWLEAEQTGYRGPSFVDVAPKAPRKRVTAMPVAKVGERIESLRRTPMQKLAALLAVNCAMGQLDMASLTPAKIDWDGRRLTYIRAKVDHHDTALEVTYPLWRRTWELLNKLGKRDGNLLLTTRHGRPLAKSCGYDIIGGLLLRTGPGFRELRKAAGNAIRQHAGEAVGDYFLGHVPQGVGRSNYFELPQEELDAAVAWLGKQLGQV